MAGPLCSQRPGFLSGKGDCGEIIVLSMWPWEVWPERGTQKLQRSAGLEQGLLLKDITGESERKNCHAFPLIHSSHALSSQQGALD